MFGKIRDFFVGLFLAVVSYWRGRVDQEEKDKKETKAEIKDAEDTRKGIDAAVRDATSDEREQLRKPYYRD